VSFTRIKQVEMAYITGVRNAHAKLPTSLVRSAGWQ
jgi:hypothetical protein